MPDGLIEVCKRFGSNLWQDSAGQNGRWPPCRPIGGRAGRRRLRCGDQSRTTPAAPILRNVRGFGRARRISRTTSTDRAPLCAVSMAMKSEQDCESDDGHGRKADDATDRCRIPNELIEKDSIKGASAEATRRAASFVPEAAIAVAAKERQRSVRRRYSTDHCPCENHGEDHGAWNERSGQDEDRRTDRDQSGGDQSEMQGSERLQAPC